MSNPWEEHLAAVARAQEAIRLAARAVGATANAHNDAHQALAAAVGSTPSGTAQDVRLQMDAAAVGIDEALYRYKAAVEILDLYKEGL